MGSPSISLLCLSKPKRPAKGCSWVRCCKDHDCRAVPPCGGLQSGGHLPLNDRGFAQPVDFGEMTSLLPIACYCFALLAAWVQRNTRSTIERQTTLSRRTSSHRVQPSRAKPATRGAWWNSSSISSYLLAPPLATPLYLFLFIERGGASTEVFRKIFPSLWISTFVAEVAKAFWFGKVHDPHRNDMSTKYPTSQTAGDRPN